MVEDNKWHPARHRRQQSPAPLLVPEGLMGRCERPRAQPTVLLPRKLRGWPAAAVVQWAALLGAVSLAGQPRRPPTVSW